MPGPLAGDPRFIYEPPRDTDPPVTIQTNAFSFVQAPSRAVFYPWPAFQLGICPFRCLGLPHIHRKRCSGSKRTGVGNRTMFNSGASMRSPRSRAIPVLEGWEEGGVPWCKIGSNDTYEIPRRSGSTRYLDGGIPYRLCWWVHLPSPRTQRKYNSCR
jgi:hypothetical protein